MNNKTSGKYHASVTSSFSKTKGFFCFSFNKRSPKDTLGKLSFLHTLFLENEAQINKNNYAMMLFMSKQVSLPKISSILQKIKIGPKCYIAPFLHESLQLASHLKELYHMCQRLGVVEYWSSLLCSLYSIPRWSCELLAFSLTLSIVSEKNLPFCTVRAIAFHKPVCHCSFNFADAK